LVILGGDPVVHPPMILPAGFFVVQPNEARVLVLFGKYIGSVRDSGFCYANPFAIKRHVSLRIRNFNSEKIKVNDLHGNPIEIAAVVVWRVVDSARALFDVDHYENFIASKARRPSGRWLPSTRMMQRTKTFRRCAADRRKSPSG